MNKLFTIVCSCMILAFSPTDTLACTISKAKTVNKQPKEKTLPVSFSGVTISLPEHIVFKYYAPKHIIENGNKANIKGCGIVFPFGTCNVTNNQGSDAVKAYFDSQNRLKEFNPDNLDSLDHK